MSRKCDFRFVISDLGSAADRALRINNQTSTIKLQSGGFTLIELLIVIAIIAVLRAVIVRTTMPSQPGNEDLRWAQTAVWGDLGYDFQP